MNFWLALSCAAATSAPHISAAAIARLRMDLMIMTLPHATVRAAGIPRRSSARTAAVRGKFPHRSHRCRAGDQVNGWGPNERAPRQKIQEFGRKASCRCSRATPRKTRIAPDQVQIDTTHFRPQAPANQAFPQRASPSTGQERYQNLVVKTWSAAGPVVVVALIARALARSVIGPHEVGYDVAGLGQGTEGLDGGPRRLADACVGQSFQAQRSRRSRIYDPDAERSDDRERHS